MEQRAPGAHVPVDPNALREAACCWLWGQLVPAVKQDLRASAPEQCPLLSGCRAFSFSALAETEEQTLQPSLAFPQRGTRGLNPGPCVL